MKNLQITKTEVLSDNWYILRKYTYRFQQHGQWVERQREAYDRGDGATILLYNREKGTVILTRQFRLPTYVNGNDRGMLIEACAGLLDKDNPEVAIRRETEEETGYKIGAIEKVFEAYMSPGSVTEVLYFFVAEYTPSMKVHAGGGLEEEEEEIEVLELPFERAWEMMNRGEIRDAKTIMLLQYLRIKGYI
jgi:nudix-type nucleoside diphosphatase (YffH/AdpP family)